MAAVTIDAGARNAYYSAGNVGWSARSLFAYRTAIQQLAGPNNHEFGAVASSMAFAQSFTTSGAIAINEVRVAILKVVSPTDDLSLAIYSDTGANLPNTSIATAANVYNGAALSTSSSWLSYQFSTPVSLSASTKYWIVVTRATGAGSGTGYRFANSTSSVYSGGGVSILVNGVWGAESATEDAAFQILTETPSALYAVTQSTEPALHVWKSTDDGASWSEQDASNNPSVTDATFPFDACDTRSGPYIVTGRMTAANTTNAKVFNMSTDTWDSGEFGTTPPTDISNERSIRISCDNRFVTNAPGSVWLTATDSGDDADVNTRRVADAGSAWGAELISLSGSSTESSLCVDQVVDKTPLGFVHRYNHDPADTFRTRSITNVNTQGTTLAIDATAADVETEHVSATYQIYQTSNVDTIIAAYIDVDGHIQERTQALEVTSASITQGTQHEVAATTTTAGRQLSTCVYDGDGYVVVSVSGTGITYYIDAGLAGSWDGGTAWKTGLTDTPISQALSIPGVGLAVVYTENGDAKIDFIAVAAGGGATGNATVGTATAAGGTHTGTAVVSETGTATVGTASAAGGSHTATAGTTGVHTASDTAATGGSHTGSYVAHQTGTATVGTATAAGGTHTGVAVVHETGTATVGTASTDGGAHTGSAATTGVATVGTAPAAGGAHTGSFVANQTGTHTASDAAAVGGTHTAAAVVHETGTHTASDAAAAGGTHTGSAATIGVATAGTASATGGTHTGDASVVLDETGTATVGTASAAGGDHAASAGIGTTGTTTTGTASSAGGTHSGTADTAGAHTTGTASATGHTATGTAGLEATGTATVGTATATGGTHTATAQAIATATVGTATAEGFSHTGVSAAADDGIHVRGQATAEGGTHTGVVTASATTTTGTATAQGGTHTAGYTATGQHTVGTATAAGGSHVGSAGTTGAAVSGSADAGGASHTATASTTGAHVAGSAVATGHDATGTVAYTGIVTVGEATATGGEHTATATSVGLVVVGEATAEGGLHIIRVGELLDEYISAGRTVTIIPAGRVSHGTVSAGRQSDLVPAGKP